jgi:hypothetical protein
VYDENKINIINQFKALECKAITQGLIYMGIYQIDKARTFIMMVMWHLMIL